MDGCARGDMAGGFLYYGKARREEELGEGDRSWGVGTPPGPLFGRQRSQSTMRGL